MFYKGQPVDVLIEVTAGRGVVAWWASPDRGQQMATCRLMNVK